MAGVQSLAKVPHVTAEMVNDNNEEITSMDKLTIIRELTAADADLLPTTVKDAVMATAQTPPEVALVTEMRQELGDGDILAVIRELKQEKAERAKTAVVERITELVNDEEKGIKMTSARSIVMELVRARNPQTVDEADAAYDEVIKTEAVTEMLKSAVQSKGGPALRIGLQSQNGKSVDQWFPLPTTNGGK
jgi:ABC-type uncharacterized transport system auxiliary subunit